MARLQILRHPAHAVLYIRFSGDITGADFLTALRGAYASPLRRNGDASVWDFTDARSVVADLADLHALDAQGSALAQRGGAGPILIVAPQADAYTLARLYSHYGARTGRVIETFYTRADAWAHLGVVEPGYDSLRPLLAPVSNYDAGASASRRA